jgi:hypothetical protein
MKNLLGIQPNENLIPFEYEGASHNIKRAYQYQYFKDGKELCGFVVKSLKEGRQRRDEYLKYHGLEA